MGPNPLVDPGLGEGGAKSKKVKKSIFGRSFCFDPTSLTESPATSYAASRPLIAPPDPPKPFSDAAHPRSLLWKSGVRRGHEHFGRSSGKELTKDFDIFRHMGEKFLGENQKLFCQNTCFFQT